MKFLQLFATQRVMKIWLTILLRWIYLLTATTILEVICFMVSHCLIGNFIYISYYDRGRYSKAQGRLMKRHK